MTDRGGGLVERIEYAPYGEVWVEHRHDIAGEPLPYRFTGKELDSETNFYYYGARYLDPRTSRWLSTDPAMGDYIPGAPINDEVRRNNQNLPGMGGVFNTVNLHVYHYSGNNPVKYMDPDGRDFGSFINNLKEKAASVTQAVVGFAKDSKVGAVMDAAEKLLGKFGLRTAGRVVEKINAGVTVVSVLSNMETLTDFNASTTDKGAAAAGLLQDAIGLTPGGSLLNIGAEAAAKSFSEFIN